MQITPFNDHVILDIDAAKEKERTSGGLFLPDSDTEDNFAIVIAKGPLAPPTLSLRDRVAIPRNHGTKLVINGRTYVAVKAGDIIMKLDPDPTKARSLLPPG